MIKVFNIVKAIDLLEDSDLLEKYNAILTSTSGNKLMFHPNHFLISKDKDKLMSKDYRVLSYDHSGKVPEDVLLHASTVALLMLSGNMDYAKGYSHIQDLLNFYGKVSFTFQMNGYLHIVIGEEPKIKYKASTLLKDPPKS